MPYGFETTNGTVYPDIPYAPGIPALGYLDPGSGVAGTSITVPSLPALLPSLELPNLSNLGSIGADVGGTFVGSVLGSAAVPIVGTGVLLYLAYKVAQKRKWI